MLGLPYVEGYKPLGNYQEVLRDVVIDRVDRTPELVSLVQAEVEQPPELPAFDEILRAPVDPPDRRERRETNASANGSRHDTGGRTTCSWKHGTRHSVGPASSSCSTSSGHGLVAADRPRLAGRVEQVSLTRGDFLGFRKEPKLFRLPGPVRESCQLETSLYVARVG